MYHPAADADAYFLLRRPNEWYEPLTSQMEAGAAAGTESSLEARAFSGIEKGKMAYGEGDLASLKLPFSYEA